MQDEDTDIVRELHIHSLIYFFIWDVLKSGPVTDHTWPATAIEALLLTVPYHHKVRLHE
jgi:hypothetical protein